MDTKKKFTFITFTLLTMSCLFSCNKDELFQKIMPKEGEVILDCSSYTQWHFFSFDEEKIIGSCDANNETEYNKWFNRTDWDLAFHRQDIKTNSGKSGNGKGGIVEYNFNGASFNFDIVNSAPKDGYAIDTEDSIIYDMSQMMQGVIGYVHTGLAQPTKRWATLTDMQNSRWEYAQKVFIVRTAEGKFAKIYLKNFKNNTGTSGTITMQYFYQNDGNTDFNLNN